MDDRVRCDNNDVHSVDTLATRVVTHLVHPWRLPTGELLGEPEPSNAYLCDPCAETFGALMEGWGARHLTP